MTKLLFVVALTCLAFPAISQRMATKDAQGNFIAVTVQPTVENVTHGATKTDATYTDKDGTKYPVYLTANGKMFALKTSKAGRPYRYYFSIK